MEELKRPGSGVRWKPPRSPRRFCYSLDRGLEDRRLCPNQATLPGFALLALICLITPRPCSAPAFHSGAEGHQGEVSRPPRGPPSHLAPPARLSDAPSPVQQTRNKPQPCRF